MRIQTDEGGWIRGRPVRRGLAWRAALALAWGSAAGMMAAQPTANDLLSQNLFEPELIQHLQDKLALTEAQRVNFRMEIQAVQERVAHLQNRIREETELLQPLMAQDRLDEEKIVAQSDKILRLEQDVKRTQLKLLIRIKNQLTPPQRARLQAVKNKQAVLQQKLTTIQEMIIRQQQQGRDLAGLGRFKTEFDSLVHAGQLDRAEAVLDRALRFLQEGDAQP